MRWSSVPSVIELKELEGAAADPKALEDYKVERVLVRADFPLLLHATTSAPKETSTRRRKAAKSEERSRADWIVTWCDRDEPSDTNATQLGVRDTWMAIRVSPDRLRQLLEDHLSLREVILHCEYGLVLYTAVRAAEPEQVFRVDLAALPASFVPKREITLSGRLLLQLTEPVAPNQLLFTFHLIARYIKGGQLSWTISGPFEEWFQKFVLWAAHKMDGTSKHERAFPADDWSALNSFRSAVGSYQMFCTSNARTEEEVSFVVRSCEQLKILTESKGGAQSVAEVESAVGPNALDYAHRLFSFVSQNDLTVTVKWAIDERAGHLELNKRTTDRALAQIGLHRKQLRQNATLTVELSETDLELLQRKVVGQGGWQSTLRRIQHGIVGNRVTLTPDQVDQIVKFAQRYGQGGFQDRLQAILRAIRRWEVSFAGIQ
jgi:hypothetical protein